MKHFLNSGYLKELLVFFKNRYFEPHLSVRRSSFTAKVLFNLLLFSIPLLLSAQNSSTTQLKSAKSKIDSTINTKIGANLVDNGNDTGGGGGGGGTTAVDCVLSDWSDWSECDSECGGQSFRTRTVLVPASNGGTACGPLIEYRDCIDEIPPVPPTPPADLQLQCAGDVPDPVQLTAVDACSGNITVSPVDNYIYYYFANKFKLERTWTFTDASGNIASITQTITVESNKPTIVSRDIPDIKLDSNCNILIPDYRNTIVYYDDCTEKENLKVVQYPEPGRVFSGLRYQNATIYFSVTDEDDNTVTQSFHVDIKDTIPPSVFGPAQEQVLYLDNNCSAVLGDYTSLVTATDCSSTLTFRQFPGAGTRVYGSGQTIVLVYAVDESNNASPCQIKVNKVDTIPPATPASPANLDLQCASEVPEAIQLIAIDGCSGEIKAFPTDVTTPGSSVNDFSITRTWTFTDASGNASSISQNITVHDDTTPTISCVGDQTRTSDAGQCYYTVSGTEFDPTDYNDNCSVDSITNNYNGESTLDGATFPFGKTTVVWTVKDASGNETSCSFVVDVNKVETLTTLTVTPGTQQYSDTVTLTAEITPYQCDFGGDLGGTVTFMIGDQTMGTASIVDGKAELADVALLEPTPFGTAPTGQMAPGVHTVTALFNNTASNYLVTNPTADLTITTEDANVEYTGQSLQATPNATSSTTTVVLSANIQDVEDGLRGDIRNAKVKFVNRDNGTDISGWIPVVNLINPGDATLGTVSFPWVVSINSNSESYTIGIVIDNGYYFRNSSEDDAIVTIYKPSGDFITGAGFIRPSSSSGQYASTNGLKSNFGFNVGYNKKGNKLQGHINIIFRRLEVDGLVHVYQIKSNSTQSLGVNIADENAKVATFITKTNLMDITDPLNVISISGNLTLKVDMTDRGEPGNDDLIGFGLTDDSGTLIYSSNWTGIKTSELQLSAGNLLVHSGFSAESTTKSAQIDILVQDATDETPFEVKAWPIPSNDQFYVNVKTSNTTDEVSINVYDINGRLLHSNVFDPRHSYSFGNNLESGIYFVKVTQKDRLQSFRVIKN